MTECHGNLSERAHGSMTAFLLLDRLEPCLCGHRQDDHDEDDRCIRCGCVLFEYDEERSR